MPPRQRALGRGGSGCGVLKGAMGPETKDLGLTLALPPIHKVPFIPNTEYLPCQEWGWA